MKTLLAAAVLLAAALSGCATPKDEPAPQGNPRVLIRTTLGDMVAEIYADKAPATAANFLTYVDEGFYKDRQFYRIERGFVTQGGGERQGDTGKHPPVVNEAKASGLRNLKYTLAMARTSAPNSATTEFYINAVDNVAGNPTSRGNLDPGGVSPDGYAVFGIVVEGRDVADRLNAHTGPTPTFTITRLSGGVSTGTGGATVATSATRTGTTAASTSATGTGAPSQCPSIPDTGRSPPGPVELDLITPGVWNVCSTTETMYVWVHNNGTGGKDYTWRITGPNGTALPAGWSIAFASPSGTLSPVGTKGTSGGRPTYPDWAASRVTLRLPAGQASGTVAAELHAAGATRAFTVHVHAPQAVSGPGSQVTVQYDGRFEDDGSRFDDGSFDTALGSGRTVPGFDNGLMGLARGETATLHIPPPFAYGYDNVKPTPQQAQQGYPDMTRFNGRTLVFTVTIQSLR